MIGNNMFGKLSSGIPDTARMAMEAAQAQQQASANTAGINPMTDPLGAVASLQKNSERLDGTIQPISRFLSGAVSVPQRQRFQQGASTGVSPVAGPSLQASAQVNPTASVTADPMQQAYAAAASNPDPYNNAIRTPQQDAIGQIQGNAFMRDRSLYI